MDMVIPTQDPLSALDHLVRPFGAPLKDGTIPKDPPNPVPGFIFPCGAPGHYSTLFSSRTRFSSLNQIITGEIEVWEQKCISLHSPINPWNKSLKENWHFLDAF